MARLTQSCVKYLLLQHLGGIQQEAKQNHLVTYDSLLEQQNRKKENKLTLQSLTICWKIPARHLLSSRLEAPPSSPILRFWSDPALEHILRIWSLMQCYRHHNQVAIRTNLSSTSISAPPGGQNGTEGRSWVERLVSTCRLIAAHVPTPILPHRSFKLSLKTLNSLSRPSPIPLRSICVALSLFKSEGTHFSTQTKPSQASCQLARPMMKVSTLHSFVLAYLTTLDMTHWCMKCYHLKEVTRFGGTIKMPLSLVCDLQNLMWVGDDFFLWTFSQVSKDTLTLSQQVCEFKWHFTW